MSWLANLRALHKPSRSPIHKKLRRHDNFYRPSLEVLEEREVPAGTTYVDDDWAGMPHGTVVNFPGNPTPAIIGTDAFARIQDGINNTDPGGNVNVAAGNYVEQLVINQDLNLNGAGKGQTVIATPSVLAPDVSGRLSLVRVGDPQNVGPGATVGIQDVTITGPGPGQFNSINFGLYVNGNSTLNLSDSGVMSIRDEPLSGIQTGIGILVGRASQNQVGHAVITNVCVTDYQKGGIVVDGSGSTATITDCLVVGAGPISITAQNGIQISRGAVATVTNNDVRDNFYSPADVVATGILFYQANPGSVVSGNTFSGNQVDVLDATTVTTLVSSQNPSGINQAVTFTATVSTQLPSSGHFTGTYQFYIDSAPVGGPQALDVNNQAILTLSSLAPGPHTILAEYSGDICFDSSSAEIVQEAKNLTPFAFLQGIAVVENTSRTFTLEGDDGDPGLGQTLTFAIESGPTHGILTAFNPLTGEVTYAPNAGFRGLDQFTFTVTDDTTADGTALTSAPATVDIVVLATPGAPTAIEDAYLVASDHTLRVSTAAGILRNDFEPDDHKLQAILVTGPQHGTLSLNKQGSFVYTPDPGFSGDDTFVYRAQDVRDGQVSQDTVVLIQVQGEEKDCRVQFEPLTVGQFVQDFTRVAPDKERAKDSIAALAEAFGYDLKYGDQKANFERQRSLIRVAEAGGGAVIEAQFANYVRFVSPCCMHSIIQTVSFTETRTPIKGEPTVTRRQYVEGWVIDKNGRAIAPDQHETTDNIRLFKTIDKSVRVEVAFTVGCGLYDGELITGERTEEGIKGAFDLFPNGDPSKITWSGPTRSYRLVFFVDNEGNWTFSDESTGVLRAGKLGNE